MKTLLLGLDGATFSILDPLMAQGIMPCLKELIAKGTRAELLSTPNPLTPPAWTSLMTGRSPGQHGIFDFIIPEETEDGIYLRLVDSRDIKCNTIWAIASQHKRKVLSLNFPMMFPPQRLVGYMIPGFVTGRHLRRAVYPPELYEALRTQPDINIKEIGWDLDMEKKAIQTLPPEEYEDWIRFHIRREQQWFKILRYLLENDPCDLIAYLDDGVDKLQHLAWRLIDPAFAPRSPSIWEEQMQSLCRDYYRQLDGLIADIIRRLGQDTRIFIVSDHGFGPTHDIFYLNVWLQRHGYLQWGGDAVQLDDGEEIAAMRMKTQYGLLDWEKTVAYALTPSSNGIYIRLAKEPGQPGVAPEEYESFRDELIRSLLAFTDPESGEPVVRRVMKREDVFAGSQMHLAPDLTLVLRDYGFISILNADTPLKRRREPKGMHRPEGIFIASGPGIRQGVWTNQLSILDVCPALLYSLDLPIPQDLEGRFPLEIFEPSFLAAHPSHIGAATIPSEIETPLENEGSYSNEVSLSKEEEATLFERLKALGYIE